MEHTVTIVDVSEQHEEWNFEVKCTCGQTAYTLTKMYAEERAEDFRKVHSAVTPV